MKNIIVYKMSCVLIPTKSWFWGIFKGGNRYILRIETSEGVMERRLKEDPTGLRAIIDDDLKKIYGIENIVFHKPQEFVTKKLSDVK